MSLYIPTWEEKEEAKKLRFDIFEMVMGIRRPKTLRRVRSFIAILTKDDYKEEPLRLDDFVSELDLPMTIRLMDIFKDEESYLTVKQQVDELCQRNIESYNSANGDATE